VLYSFSSGDVRAKHPLDTCRQPYLETLAIGDRDVSFGLFPAVSCVFHQCLVQW
jgi:hypothetical protein